MISKLWTKFRQSFVGEKIRSVFPDSMVNVLEHLSLAILATIFYGYPARKLTVIGVTGTDGKTTTAELIYEILTKAGKKAALISTVSAKIGQEEIETGFHVTSPHPWKLQKLLREIVNRKINYVVIESTSHGLAQNRLFGCNFKIGIVTNITHDHLDYHKTYENYLKAKAKLFKGVEVAVLNNDDESYKLLSNRLSNYSINKFVTYGIKSKADFIPENFKFKTQLLGDFNQYNCLAAIAATSSLGIPKEEIREAIALFSGVKGRMEEVKKGQDFKVVIDFAHAPNSLKNALEALNKEKNKDNKLIAVFGAAGLRDKKKRPLMGEISGKYADMTVITAEDPRTEDLNEIIEKIAQGCLKSGAVEQDKDKFKIDDKKNCFFIIPDRKEAIEFAIRKLAKKDDIVVVCGKGHEKTMCFGKKEYPWSDFRAVEESLKKN